MGGVAGIDGCPAGWFAVIHHEGKWHHGVFSTFEELMIQFPNLNYYLVDIPIGLGDKNITRTIESKLRDLLKPSRHSSVFTPPVYEALSTSDYEEAKSLNFEITGKKISIQSWNIVPKIKEVNQWLWKHESHKDIVFEAHPELCFAAMNDMVPMSHRKASFEGKQERWEVLQTIKLSVPDYIDIARSYTSQEVKKDDILDAICLCSSGLIGARNGFQLLQDHNPLDSRNIPIRLVYSINSE